MGGSKLRKGRGYLKEGRKEGRKGKVKGTMDDKVKIDQGQGIRRGLGGDSR
jgi:hypothetical protein